MAQTTYSRQFDGASPGTPGDSNFGHRASYLNDEGAAIAVGIAVAYKSEGKAELFDAGTDEIAGIVMNDFGRSPNDLSGDEGIQDGAMMSVLEEGAAYVHCEQTVTPADPVYVRHTVTTTEKLGAFRKDSDSGKARLVKGARFAKGGSATEPPIVYFSRAAEKAAFKLGAEQLVISLSAAAEAANSITVSGTIKDGNGNPVTAAKQVLVRSLAVTADKGDLSDGGDGTLKKAVNPATGENVAWMETTAAGLFQVAVANDAAEETLVQASTDGALTATLKLTFA